MTSNYKFIKKVKETINKHSMLNEEDSVLVALSGGADSVALLYAMIETAGKKRVSAAHFNHLLRNEESYRDEEFSRDLCRDLGISFFNEKSDVRAYSKENKLSLEEAARFLRYRFLNKIMDTNGFSKLATAHHLDDNSELILMNMIRGAGQDGLSGIPPVRENIIRPFTGVCREEILEYLGSRAFVTDSSNLDSSILRNRVRLKLIPFIKEEFNPSVPDSLNRLSEILRCDKDYFEGVVKDTFDNICCVISQKEIRIAAGDLLELHYSVGSRLIRMMIKRINGNLKKFTSTHINDVFDLAEKKGCKSIDLPSMVRIEKEKDFLFIRKYNRSLREIGTDSNLSEYSYEVSGDTKLKIPSGELRFSTSDVYSDTKSRKNVVYFDRDKLSFPLVVRNVMFGDSFHPLGFMGRMKLKKYFNSFKVPEKERWNTPVLLNNNEIIWLCGHAETGLYSVDRNTKSVFKVELSLA